MPDEGKQAEQLGTREVLNHLLAGQQRMENKLDLALNGPDDAPERGIKGRMQRVEDRVDTMDKRLATGDAQLARIEPLNGRVDMLETSEKGRVWFFRLLVGALVGELVVGCLLVAVWIVVQMAKSAKGVP